MREAWRTAAAAGPKFIVPMLLIFIIPVSFGFWLIDRQSGKISDQQTRLAQQQELLSEAQQRIAELAAEGASALTRLCALRADVQQRAEDTRRDIRENQKFLRQHPEGLVAGNVTVTGAELRAGLARLKASLEGQEATAEALGGPGCVKPG